MSKTLRYLPDGKGFENHHFEPKTAFARPDSPRGYADGGMTMPVPNQPMFESSHSAVRRPGAATSSNAVAGKAALGAYLLGEAKGVQESKQGNAPAAAPAQPLAHGGYANGGAAKKKNFIQGMHMKKGALHQQLGVPQGEKIPAKKMAAAASGNMGALAAKRAHVAKTLGTLHKADGGAIRLADAQHEADKNPKLAPMVHVTQSVNDPLPNGGFAKGGAVKRPHKAHAPKPHKAHAPPKVKVMHGAGMPLPSSEPMPGPIPPPMAAPAAPMRAARPAMSRAAPRAPRPQAQVAPDMGGADMTDGVPQLARGGALMKGRRC